MSKVAESTTQSNVSDADSNTNESPKTSLESNESHTDESHDQFKTPFESFTHHEQENTMQYLGNEVLNLVYLITFATTNFSTKSFQNFSFLHVMHMNSRLQFKTSLISQSFHSKVHKMF